MHRGLPSRFTLPQNKYTKLGINNASRDQPETPQDDLRGQHTGRPLKRPSAQITLSGLIIGRYFSQERQPVRPARCIVRFFVVFNMACTAVCQDSSRVIGIVRGSQWRVMMRFQTALFFTYHAPVLITLENDLPGRGPAPFVQGVMIPAHLVMPA